MRSRGVIFCKCMYAWQPVRVVDGEGRVRSLIHPVTVGELVECHPHHFVCEPSTEAPLYHTAMLPLDMELVEGRIYLLLPLPRLLPHLSNIFSNPPSCSCFQSHSGQAAHVTPASSFVAPPVFNPSKTRGVILASDSPNTGIENTSSNAAKRARSSEIWFSKNVAGEANQAASETVGAQQQAKQGFLSPMLMTCLVQVAKKVLSGLIPFSTRVEEGGDGPEVNMGAGFQCSRNRWRPALECISEIDLLTGVLKEGTAPPPPPGTTERLREQC
ncbi:hypothetical protein BDL97_19G041400 [Sphagnum fallax]|nr:hypothetical protein BDL97_19G041400 [Sphagnum fallax]KAH8931833.1 hypothetical protein BDL97_19G041400 [Sphagnum fallax]